MRILLRVLFIIGILLLAITAIGLFLCPSHVHVERSVLISQNRNVIFNYVNDYHNWNEWSPWFDKDTAAQYTIVGSGIGEGSTIKWESKVKDVGSGSMTMTKVIPDSLILQDLNFMENGVAKGSYIFTREGNETKATWCLDFEAGMNPLLRVMGKFMDGMVGKDFEKGLIKLKTKTEMLPPANAG